MARLPVLKAPRAGTAGAFFAVALEDPADRSEMTLHQIIRPR